MSEKITVPTLGESVTEATVSKWLKSQGEKVVVDEPIVELETDKVNVEVPAPSNGFLGTIDVKEGETVNVGSILGTINDSLKNNDTIVGASSRNKGVIKDLFINEGQFEVNYSLIKDLGWETNVGKLNEDIQVLPDNDYYQNLSYTIQSPITWNNLNSPVNNLVHTSGFKNFSDTGITSTSSAFPGIGTARISVLLDVFPEFLRQVRVDSLYNFDTAKDIFEGFSVSGAGTTTGLSLNQKSSKFIQLENINLTDFVEARTNNVLNI